jgi:hypothetical protein
MTDEGAPEMRQLLSSLCDIVVRLRNPKYRIEGSVHVMDRGSAKQDAQDADALVVQARAALRRDAK